MTLGVALDVEASGWAAVSNLEALVVRALEQALRRSGQAVMDHAEISVLLCDDRAIQDLNRDWRGQDQPTNVLSFPTPGPLARKPMLGDIAVAWETTRREAADEGKALADHLTHLLVHGLLHLVGFDHDEDTQAQAMEQLETSILAELGVADPYRDAAMREHARR